MLYLQNYDTVTLNLMRFRICNLAVLFIFIVTLLSDAVGVCAQNNLCGISDELYPIYLKASKLSTKKEGLVIADSLRVKAIAMGDKQAELRALTIPVQHFVVKRGDIQGCKKVCKALMDKSIEYDLMDFYFYGVASYTSYLILESRYIEAYKYVNEQMKYAEAHNYKQGIALGYRLQGVIQRQRGEYLLAVEKFKQSIEYIEKNVPKMGAAQNYQSICNCYRLMNDYEGVLKSSQDGLLICKDDNVRYNLKQMECYAYFMLGKYNSFRESYDYIKAHPVKEFTGTVVVRRAIELQKLMLDSKDEEALKGITQLGRLSGAEMYRLYIEYYKLHHEYLKCLEYANKFFELRNESNALLTAEDSKSMEYIYKTEEIKAARQRAIFESAKLELANTQLQLDNSELELDRSKDAIRLSKLTAEKDSLSINYQKLIARQLSDSIMQQRLRRDAKERGMKTQNIVLAIAVGVIILIALLTVAYSMRNRMIAEKLCRSNAALQRGIVELDKVKKHAREAEKMKTMFVQNMSHEIRTPLNAIVGFSQVLMDMNKELGEQEKKDLIKMISDNSELLVALVNDIFELSDLKGGTIQMKMSKVSVNAMCRDAIETVRHRKAEDVELILKTDLPQDYMVETDMRRVTQVLINMLTNAEKNTTEGSIVLSCSLQEHPGMITFSVADTGVGVPVDKMDEIFQRFKKLNNQKQGTGLGLDICRTIAGKLGGEIDIDRNYTGGARFWFTIPVTD